jgi:hypothetical protein
MPLAALLVAVALSLPSSGAEDPAVRVCELMVRAGLRAPQSFLRVAEPAVRGAEVEIAFSFLDAHRRTASDRRICRFHLAADGLFHVESFRRAHLDRRLAEAKARLGRASEPREVTMIRSEILDIGREMFVEHDRRGKAEHQAAKAGIYPIAPGLTKLKQ